MRKAQGIAGSDRIRWRRAARPPTERRLFATGDVPRAGAGGAQSDLFCCSGSKLGTGFGPGLTELGRETAGGYRQDAACALEVSGYGGYPSRWRGLVRVRRRAGSA